MTYAFWLGIGLIWGFLLAIGLIPDGGIVKGSNWTCTQSARTNASEPPEFECIQYTKEQKK